MSVTVQSDWKERILTSGSLESVSPVRWEEEAYRRYREKLQNPAYPCFFGQAGEARGEMLYTFVPSGPPKALLENMQVFVGLIGTQEHERSSLVAFFKPESALITHEDFVTRFWGVLQFLHDHDPLPQAGKTPDDPLWEFAFSGCEMFVVGSSPTYQKRKSRDLGPGMVLIFQPRHLFIDPSTQQPIAADVRHRIHRRMLAYDGMPVHPDIGFYGQPENREWKQYALPDDNEMEQGACPFHS